MYRPSSVPQFKFLCLPPKDVMAKNQISQCEFFTFIAQSVQFCCDFLHNVYTVVISAFLEAETPFATNCVNRNIARRKRLSDERSIHRSEWRCKAHV